MSLKFWEKHAEEHRKSRLLQAAATIFASVSPHYRDSCKAVNLALGLEALIERRLEQERKGTAEEDRTEIPQGF